MGSEDFLHKKKKARKVAESTRPISQRIQRPRYLIVAEGKMELAYFSWIVRTLKISRHVDIEPPTGTSPSQIFDTAQRKWEKSIKDDDTYNHVFCVFDKEDEVKATERKFHDTVQRIRSSSTEKSEENDGTEWHTITSTPCVEVWFLAYSSLISTASTRNTYRKTVGEQCKAQLKKRWPSYSHHTIAKIHNEDEEVTAQIPQAVQHAQSLRRQQEQFCDGQDAQLNADPWTNIDDLVIKLCELARIINPDRLPSWAQLVLHNAPTDEA
jgi:hypothetical protein